jgi:DegV family protein with EDD domain
VDEIRARLAERVERTYVFATLDTLEYLRRSGRVSWAQFGLGTLLSIKPLVKVYRGQVEIPEKVRTGRKARRRIVELVEAIGPLERVALLHTHANEAAESFGEQIRHLFPPGEKPVPYEVTPAIGAHAGPGAVGLACIAAN